MEKLYLCSCRDIVNCKNDYMSLSGITIDDKDYILRNCFNCTGNKTVVDEKDIPECVSYIAVYYD